MSGVLPTGTALDAGMRERLDALVALFRGAAERMEGIGMLLEEPRDRRYVAARVREANAIIDRLLSIQNGTASGQVVEWAREHFPETYRVGAGMAVRDLKAQDLLPIAGDARIHAQAVDALMGRYVSDVTEIVVEWKKATIRAGRVVLAQAGFGEEVAAGLMGGLPRRETSRLLRGAMQQALTEALPPGASWTPADLSHVEIHGRRMRVDDWAEMHARTATAETTNEGIYRLTEANGVRHVQLTAHAHAPCICTFFEGRIYALDRSDTRFPHVSVLPGTNGCLHPNCVHRLAPAVVDYLEERGDVEGRVGLPTGIEGLSTQELSRLVRDNKDRLRPYAESRDGMLPTGFRIRQRRAA